MTSRGYPDWQRQSNRISEPAINATSVVATGATIVEFDCAQWEGVWIHAVLQNMPVRAALQLAWENYGATPIVVPIWRQTVGPTGGQFSAYVPHRGSHCSLSSVHTGGGTREWDLYVCNANAGTKEFYATLGNEVLSQNLGDNVGAGATDVVGLPLYAGEALLSVETPLATWDVRIDGVDQAAARWSVCKLRETGGADQNVRIILPRYQNEIRLHNPTGAAGNFYYSITPSPDA